MLKVDVGHFLAGAEEELKIYQEPFFRFQERLDSCAYPFTLSLEEGRKIPAMEAVAERLRSAYETFLVLGIGGSSLGIKALVQFLKGPYYNLAGSPRLLVLDNISPHLARQLTDLLDWRRTGLIYISKSGSTPETAANFIYFYQVYREAGGRPQDLVFICDPGDNGMNRIARELGAEVFHLPPPLPGRYSVLSPVGLFPAALLGISGEELLEGARRVHEVLTAKGPETNPLFLLGGGICYWSARGKNIHVLFNYETLLSEFGFWFMQLWAESLGKKLSLTGAEVRAGTTPLACVGTTDQHSLLQLFKEGPDDKIYGFVTIEEKPEVVLPSLFTTEKEYAYFGGRTLGEQLAVEQLATEISLVREGRPCYHVALHDVSPASLGALFYFFEALVVFVAECWQVNPFDQPGVEEGKQITYALMGRKDYEARRPQFEALVEEFVRRRRIYTV
ncbi:glucose-6-phosphate isomerase [Ammonifex thiophilus]|uniref:Glucose-6-phosphate isomerase n=1 Tax=Ammonifex thiophilus TaxID=444093 RepID=A0A3D8P515_9THEO|nr:glucose-6-phosphate isomerase [Ammonifex thiophilus]RDV82852.1 glucose-6-phosphate isomerase [Ammonifex thiophilus]